MKRLPSRVYTEAFPNTRCFYNVFVMRSICVYIYIYILFYYIYNIFLKQKLIIVKFVMEKCIIEISYDTEHMHEYG